MEMPLLRLVILKIAEKFRVKAIQVYTKTAFMNQGHRLMVVQPGSHQVLAVAGGTTRLNVKGNSRTLWHQRLTHWDIASFDKSEISILRFGF